MCLGTKLSDRALKLYKAKGKKLGYIRVWKVVIEKQKLQYYKSDCKYHRYYKSDCKYHRYKTGFNHARKDAFYENMLIHAFRNRASCEMWGVGIGECIVECLIKPEWIVAIGKAFNGELTKLTLTTKAIVMPKYPKKKVTVREFRAAIKGKRVKTYKWE